MTLNILFRGLEERAECWRQLFATHLPQAKWQNWPEVEDKSAIDILICWKPPRDYQQDYPNLKVMFSVGAGVDQFDMATVPASVQVVRMIDPCIQQEMTEYVVMSVLNIHRNTLAYFTLNLKAQWKQLPYVKTADRTIGVLGLGNLGKTAAGALAALGFEVIGWSNTPKKIDNLECYYGASQLTAFLQHTDILVCLLPLTEDTQGLLNRTTLSHLPKGASVINVGRGQHICSGDLIELLDTEHLAYAILDVFSKEPLGENDPLWQHPKILVTPHIAAVTQNDSAGRVLVNNIQRYLESKPLIGLVDRTLGY